MSFPRFLSRFVKQAHTARLPAAPLAALLSVLLPVLLSALVPALATALVSTPSPAAAAEPARRAPSRELTAEEASGRGIAAVYSDRLHGRKTASGRVYDRNGLTVAHRTMPFGTRLKITNPTTNRSVNVEVTDRGPRHADREFDLSPAVAQAIGISPKGMGQVSWEALR